MPSPTFTTRLALTKPDPNPSTGDFVDITVISANMDKLDAAVGAVACTSGARPASPFNGQFARETDTNELIMWNGAAWVYCHTSNGPGRGRAYRCTSGTRPASPEDGRMIYETDTRRGAVWRSDTSVWEYMDGLYRARQKLTSTTASVSFTGIPSDLRSLTIKWAARGDAAVVFIDVRMRVNNNSTNVYSLETGVFEATSPTAAGSSGVSSGRIGSIPCASTANAWGNGITTIPSWDAPTGHTSYLSFVSESAGMFGGNVREMNGGHYTPGGPYTRLDFFPASGNFVAGTDFQLLGEY